jgi:pimeloyl-ACP methyl ester carboxylesterase
MLRLTALIALLLLPLATAAHALDISGTWQMAKPRYAFTIAKTKSGYGGQWYNLGEMDGALNGNPLTVSLSGNTLTLTPLRTSGVFTGTVSADGQAISGNWGTHDPTPLVFGHATAKTAQPIDPAPHKVRFVTVAPGVKLEVLDFGGGSGGGGNGSAAPLVFLAGLGHTAHCFDELALKFTARHHVYAITRRGYGVSSWPAPTDANYDSDRMGDDVLAVLDALKIEKPVLAGHSIAGQELSSVGTRHPERVSGLIYLDAAYGYAFYDSANLLATSNVVEAIIRRDLGELRNQPPPSRARALVAEIQATMPFLNKEMQGKAGQLAAQKDPPPGASEGLAAAGTAIVSNAHPYGAIKAPALILAAYPEKCAPNCDTPFAKILLSAVEQQVAFVSALNPGDKVVKLPYADHFVWRSNPDEVEREMNAFMDGLQ